MSDRDKLDASYYLQFQIRSNNSNQITICPNFIQQHFPHCSVAVSRDMAARNVPDIQDCVKLLNIGAGSLILSLDTLRPGAEAEAAAAGDTTLADLGVSRLTVEQAVAVMQTRVDLRV